MTCSIGGCNKPLYARGWCQMHYRRWSKHGDTSSTVTVHGDFAARMDRYVERTGTCWLWIGSLRNNGYGRVTMGNRSLAAHRVSYEYHVGPIPDGMNVLHSCDVRNCVNPAHLRLGTNRENTADMISRGRGHWQQAQ